MRVNKKRTTLRDEDSEDSTITEADASIPDGSTNPDGSTIPDSSVTPDAANVITVDESFSSPVQPKKSIDCSWEEVQRTDQQLHQDRMAESKKKRKTEEDLSAIKVYKKKQKTRRTLSSTLDTQEPGTQSVSDIHLSPAMDTQEPGTQSVSDIHPVESISVDAASSR